MKKLVTIILAVLLSMSLSSCFGPGMNDWRYVLPNNYEIWHINSREIMLGKRETEYGMEISVHQYVTEFCYNDTYILIKGVSVPKDLSEEIDKSKPNFYIINSIDDIIYGPLTEAEFNEQCKNYDLTGLTSWIETVPAPNGAIYE